MDHGAILGVETIDAFMKFAVKYSLTTVNTVSYFCYMVMKIFPLEQLLVSRRFKTAMCEKELLDIARKQCFDCRTSCSAV